MPTVFGRIAAMIPVTDIPRALRFYVDVLGTTKVFENGDPVSFAILERDAAELHLTLSTTHRATELNVAHRVADATVLHHHLVVHGIEIGKGMRDADYGSPIPMETGSTSASSCSW